MEKPQVSTDELIRLLTAHPPVEGESVPFFSNELPPPDAVALPPILVEEIPEDAPLAERLAFPEAARPVQRCKKRRTFLGLRIPSKFDDLPWFALIPALICQRRGLGLATSVIFHLIVFIFLAFIALHIRNENYGEPIDASFASPEDFSLAERLGTGDELSASLDSLDQTPLASEAPVTIGLSDEEAKTLLADTPSVESVSIHDLLADSEKESESGRHLFREGSTSGRTAETRRKGLPGREGDTTDESEKAVEAGLAWLAAHQLPDGGWAFDLEALDDNHREGNCRGQCSNSTATAGGSTHRRSLHPSRMAATGIALLPFLGAGYTPTEPSAYQRTVAAGLEFLKYRAITTEHGSDLRGNEPSQGMYTQAIVSLTLCEAYEMTRDSELKPLALGSVRFIEASQHDDGGWRYQAVGDSQFFAHTPGDTSVSGWQMLALKSALSAGLEVQASTFYRVGAFLDNVSSDNGSAYRYQPNSNESERKMRGTTAVGLLMREYLGWDPNRRALRAGLEHLNRWFREMDDDWDVLRKNRENRNGRTLVSPDGRLIYNLYYAYYAALAMHHVGGRNWHRCFADTRDFLIQNQSDGGGSAHEAGSWLFYDQYLNDGGRLLNTAMAILILETPYRYLPMYQK